MNDISNYVGRVAGYFQSRLGSSLVEVYKLGSLAHGGFSRVYSDIDIGVLLDCREAPAQMTETIDKAKAMDREYGKKLSVFWGHAEYSWGRLPVIDRLDLLDHGAPLLHGRKPVFRRPTEDEIHQALRESFEKSYQPRVPELARLVRLEPQDRKPYIRTILYPARLIYTWDRLAVASNDHAVAYLHEVEPPGLDLNPIDMALACRQEKCTPEEVFALGADLHHQFANAISYIFGRNK